MSIHIGLRNVTRREGMSKGEIMGWLREQGLRREEES